MTLDSIIDDILKREGGYVDHPADRGGPTKYGVTLKTLQGWRKDDTLTAKDVEALTAHEARLIYRQNYFLGPRFDFLPQHLWPLMVDAAVNHGPSSAVKMLQKVLGVLVDGVCGGTTVDKAKEWDAKKLAAYLLAERARKYGRIVSKDHSQAVFAEGWMNRLASLMEAEA